MTELQNQISEKIFKRTKSRSGKTTFSKKLIGQIVGGVVDDEIVIGYSLLHKNDRYDFIKGVRHPGHGKKMAIRRALLYREKIEVPPSILKQVVAFGARCDRYFKFKGQARHQSIGVLPGGVEYKTPKNLG